MIGCSVDLLQNPHRIHVTPLVTITTVTPKVLTANKIDVINLDRAFVKHYNADQKYNAV